MNYVMGHIYEYLLEPMLHRWKNRVAEWIAQDSPGLTLDICCGTGKQCRLIAQHSPVIGLDLDLNMVKFAKSMAPELDFVCADAGYLPFKKNSFQNANISLALHDKPESLCTRIVEQATFILKPRGHFFIIDFEKPFSLKMKIGYAFIYIIEFMAGWEHFSNSRNFVKSGGHTSFLHRHALTMRKNHKSQWGSSTISMNRVNV